MVSTQEAGRPKARALWAVEGWAEVRTLGRGSVGRKVLVRRAFEGHRGLKGPCLFSRPE